MLPYVEIARWQRVAETLNAAFKIEWGAEVVCLFELPCNSVEHGGFIRYEAAEILRSTTKTEGSTQWVPISALGSDALNEGRDYTAIKRVIGTCTGEVETAPRGPFARIGWFCDLCSWIESVVRPMGVQLTGPFTQLNASPSFCLIRFETIGRGLWFKAVGEPNQREFAITCMLSRVFPSRVPHVLATRPECNGWLTYEAEGELLGDVRESRTWHRVAADLADLQINSCDRTPEILATGARDLRAEGLSKQIGHFVDTTQRLMEQQPKTPPPILDLKELRLLEDRIRAAFGVVQRINIPDSLGHLDFNPGNIVISSQGCVFLDWAEAYVGNPFLTFQYLREHFQRMYGKHSNEESHLVESYAAPWLRILSHDAVDAALAVSPLLAVVSYACGTGMLTDEERLKDAEFAGYLRGLARRMDREARVWADGSSKCITRAVA